MRRAPSTIFVLFADLVLFHPTSQFVSVISLVATIIIVEKSASHTFSLCLRVSGEGKRKLTLSSAAHSADD
jgi:hypothetical protein